MSGGQARNGVPPSHGQGTLPAGLYNRPIENLRPMRVVVIGAGFSGIYCGVRIPQRLRNIDLCIYDKNAGVGGTWFENRYPGCTCDIPSHSYQYTFAPNPHWSRIYAPAKEILAYLQGVADKFSVHRFVKLSHEVQSAVWQNDISKWQLQIQNLETGQIFLDEADIVINAKGLLNTIKWPEIEDFNRLKIPTMHSANWDEAQVFEGKRVGVIGSGSSSIQIVPALQKLKDIHLTCFVRSKTWIARPFADPIMKDLELESYEFSQEQRERFERDPEHYLKFRTILERDANSIHSLTLQGSPLQKTVREAFTAMMSEKLASKPEILESILPDFSVGCRRLTPGPGYLEALVSDNVAFVNTHIARAHETGLELVDGRKLDFDILVCATGFDAATAPPFGVVGVNGQTLQERFADFPETYLSIATNGFPNFFMMFGPNGGIGTGPLTTILESAGDYIIKAIRKMQKDSIKKLEIKQRRVKDFVQYMDNYFKKTVYMDGCQTWYRKNNRVTVLWPGSALHAMETFRSPRWEDWDYVYEGEEEGGEEVNRMGWLGDGWSLLQVDHEVGDLAYFLQPGQVDIPDAPLPEQTAANRQRPYAY